MGKKNLYKHCLISLCFLPQTIVLFTVYMTSDQAPVWVAIEEDLTHPYPVQAFITETSDVIPYDNPILTLSQETWQVTYKIMDLNPNFTNKTSLWHNKSLWIGKKKILRVLGQAGHYLYW